MELERKLDDDALYVCTKDVIRWMLQLLPEEAKEICERGLFVVTPHSIERMKVTANGVYTSDTVYRTRDNLTFQGCYFIKTKEEVMEITEGKVKL